MCIYFTCFVFLFCRFLSFADIWRENFILDWIKRSMNILRSRISSLFNGLIMLLIRTILHCNFTLKLISIDIKFMFIWRKILSLVTINTDKQCINMVLSWYLYAEINEFITIIFIWIHSLKFSLSIKRRNDIPFNLFYLFIHLSFWWWSRKTENSPKRNYSFIHPCAPIHLFCFFYSVLFSLSQIFEKKFHLGLKKGSMNILRSRIFSLFNGWSCLSS